MAILAVGTATIDTDRGVVERAGASLDLAEAELRVVDALASGRLVERSVLEEAAGSERALRRALEGLRRKLGPNEAGRIEAKRGHGYRLDLAEATMRRTNIGPSRNAFFGRDREMREVRERLHTGPVSLIGPPGVGKSRLGRELAKRMASSLPGGVWEVSLARATDTDQVVSAVADVLDIPLQSVGAARRRSALQAALPHTGRALIVLDDVDGIADAVGALLEEWARAAPDLLWITTSRRSLGAAPEAVVRVDPLQPGHAQALLADRAGRPIGSGVAELATRLDHLPLALELVAPRLALLGADSLLAIAPESLAGSALESAIDASVVELEPRAIQVLAALAVFPGDASLDAALAVAGSDARGTFDELVRRSLLDRDGDRVRLLRAIRQRVLDRFGEPHALRAAELRHAAFFADLATRASRVLRTSGSADAIDTLAPELDNLLHAASHVDVTRAARVMIALSPLVGPRLGFSAYDAQLRSLESRSEELPESLRLELRIMRGIYVGRLEDYRRAAEMLEETLDRASTLGDPALLGRSCTALGTALLRAGERDRPLELHRRGAALADQVGHHAMRAAALVMVAENLRLQHDLPGAIDAYRQVLAVTEATGDHRGIANVLANWGGLAATLGHDEADELLERAAELAHQLRDRRVQAYVDSVRARLDASRGDLARARERIESAIRIQTELGLRRNRASSLVNLAEVSVVSGDVERAAGLYRDALRVHTELGDAVWIALDTANLGLLALHDGQLAAARRDVTWSHAQLDRIGHRHAGLARLILALIEAISGRPDEACTHFDAVAAELRQAAPPVRAAVDVVAGRLGRPVVDPASIAVQRERSDIVWLLAAVCERP